MDSRVALPADGMSPVTDELMAFFKLFIEANRLKIAGLVALQPSTADEVAGALKLLPIEAGHHLTMLREAGLITLDDGGVYTFCASALPEWARRVFSQMPARPAIEDDNADAFDRKVLADFSDASGRLKSLPTQQKKWLAVLRHCNRLFEPEVRYSEKQVNEILRQVNDDTAALRRGLVDTGFMARQAGIYWLTPETAPATGGSSNG